MLIKAEWINFETGDRKDEHSKYGNPAPYFRKEFHTAGKVKRAELVLSAMGVLKAYINGKPAAEDYMSPGWTDYRKRMPSVSLDVTGLIEKDNAIGIIAGDGWAVGYMGNRMERCNYCDRIFVMAQLEIEYEDGKKDFVVTDGSWKAAKGEILRTDNYMGEYIDHRLDPGDFSVYGYDDSCWSGVYSLEKGHNRLIDVQRAPITTVKHTLTPEFMYADKNGRLVYDFKQNMVGVVSASVKGESGAKLIFKYGEMLNPDGTVYTDNLRKAEATDTYVLAGGSVEKFRPLFTFHGFRYMSLEIIGNAEIFDLKGEVMYSDLKKTGEFSCSDEVVNKLYSNIVWGQRGNFLNVPTDCPQRDERLGWTGDAQIFVGSAMYNMDCKAFYEKYLCDVRDSQFGSGAVGGIAPHVPHHSDYFAEVGRLSAGWADVITVIPYEHYLMYGDKQTLYDNIGAMKAFVGYCRENSDGLIRPEWDNYGDWLNVNAETDHSVLSTLYFAYSTLLTAKACSALGDLQADEYYSLYGDIVKAFRAAFVGADNVIKSDTQTAYLLAYAFGVMDKAEIKENLLRKIHEASDHLTTGFLGVKFLLPVLCELGESALAYKLLTNTTYPSWGYSVVNGATTVWERWNSYTIEHGFGDVRMNSFNHYSLGSCCEWMFKYSLGICPSEEAPGFKKIKVKPFVDFSGRLTYAEGSYDCAFGKIKASWKVKDGIARYKIDMPEGAEAVYDFSAYSSAELKDGEWILKA